MTAVTSHLGNVKTWLPAVALLVLVFLLIRKNRAAFMPAVLGLLAGLVLAASVMGPSVQGHLAGWTNGWL